MEAPDGGNDQLTMRAGPREAELRAFRAQRGRLAWLRDLGLRMVKRKQGDPFPGAALPSWGRHLAW